MKELARNDAIGKIHILPGDTLIGNFTDERGVNREVARYEITEAMTIDSFVVIATEPGELGLSRGIGGVFGTKEKAAEPKPTGDTKAVKTHRGWLYK